MATGLPAAGGYEARGDLVDALDRDDALPAPRAELVPAALGVQEQPRAAALLDGAQPCGDQRPGGGAVGLGAQPLHGPADDRPPHAAVEQGPDDGRLGDVLDGVDARVALGLGGADVAAARPLPDRRAGHADQLAD